VKVPKKNSNTDLSLKYQEEKIIREDIIVKIGIESIEVIEFTPEQEKIIKQTVYSTLLNKSSPEGEAIHHFISNFGVVSKKRSSQNGTITILNILRRFIDGISCYYFLHYEQSLFKLLDDNTINAENFKLNLNNLVEECHQNAILLPIRDYIFTFILQESRELDERIQRNIILLQNASQDFFGVKTHLQSKDNWLRAIEEFKTIDKYHVPIGKLKAILSSARAIYDEWKKMICLKLVLMIFFRFIFMWLCMQIFKIYKQFVFIFAICAQILYLWEKWDIILQH